MLTSHQNIDEAPDLVLNREEPIGFFREEIFLEEIDQCGIDKETGRAK